MTGDIGLTSLSQSVNQTANISTSGRFTGSANIDYEMAAGAIIQSSPSLILTATQGSIEIGQLRANRVGLQANDDILDAKSDTSPNVIATDLVIRSTQGAIGGPAPGNPATSNPNALDTQVQNLSAESLTGVYIQELDDLTITNVSSTSTGFDSVHQLNFESDASSLRSSSSTIAGSSDITSRAQIKVVALNGDITVDDGSDADGVGIESTAAGDILIETRTAGNDLLLNTAITSQGGHINLISANAINVLDDVRTIAAGSILIDAIAGAVRVADGGDADSDGIQSVDGDILVRTGANLTVDATIQSQRGDIGLVAQGNVEQRVDVNTGAGNLLARAGGSFTMDANSRLVAGESLIVISDTSSIQLGLVSAVNVAMRAQTSIIDGNAADELNVTASKLSMRALTGSIGQPALEVLNRSILTRSIPVYLSWRLLRPMPSTSRKRIALSSIALMQFRFR